jgi:hypothetical protein
MKLFDLFEADGKSVSFVFGRLNPPTIGHKQLLDTAAKSNKDYKIFVSQSQDKKKNPLDYETKIKFIKAMFPQHAGRVVQDTSLNTIMKVSSYLYDQGYSDVTIVAGSDRIEELKKLIEAYNGVEGKSHGYYKFNTINYVSSGDRDPDAEGVEGISASLAREKAAQGDLEGFAAATGAGKLSKELYAAVRQGMGVQESNSNVSEAPIEFDPQEPMNPMIYGAGGNPAKLQTRMLRAAGQLKDLAKRSENAGAMEWESISKNFDELAMNIGQIKHGLEELAKQRKKGGVRSRGIDPNIG